MNRKRNSSNASSAFFTPPPKRKPATAANLHQANAAEAFVELFAKRELEFPGTFATMAGVLSRNEAHKPIVDRYRTKLEAAMASSLQSPSGPKQFR